MIFSHYPIQVSTKLNDNFNLVSVVDSDSDEESEDESASALTGTAAHLLFGLLHQRFIITPPGLSAMVP